METNNKKVPMQRGEKATRAYMEVMKAYLDGKEIECRYRNGSTDEWLPCLVSSWDFVTYEYRVKPEEPVLVHIPYSNTDEFIAACKEHGPWFKGKTTDNIALQAVYADDEGIRHVTTVGAISSLVPYKELIYLCHWDDGSPMGKEVEYRHMEG